MRPQGAARQRRRLGRWATRTTPPGAVLGPTRTRTKFPAPPARPPRLPQASTRHLWTGPLERCRVRAHHDGAGSKRCPGSASARPASARRYGRCSRSEHAAACSLTTDRCLFLCFDCPSRRGRASLWPGCALPSLHTITALIARDRAPSQVLKPHQVVGVNWLFGAVQHCSATAPSSSSSAKQQRRGSSILKRQLIGGACR